MAAKPPPPPTCQPENTGFIQGVPSIKGSGKRVVEGVFVDAWREESNDLGDHRALGPSSRNAREVGESSMIPAGLSL